MPLIRRLPKRGFNNAAFHKNYAVVNLSDLARFENGSVVNEASLRQANLIRGNFFGVKILGDGELKQALTIHADKVSASAREKIEKAGGTIALPEARRANRAGQQKEEEASKDRKNSSPKSSLKKAKKKTARK